MTLIVRELRALLAQCEDDAAVHLITPVVLPSDRGPYIVDVAAAASANELAEQGIKLVDENRRSFARARSS